MTLLGNRQRATGNSQAGFTITEMLVVTVVIGIMSVLLVDFIVDKIVKNAELSAENNIQLEAKLTLDSINNDIKHGAESDDSNRWEDNNAPDPSDPLSWTGDSDTLILARPATDSNGDILYQDQGSYVTYKDNHIYFVEDSILYRRVLAAETAGNSATTTCPEDQATSSCPADTVLAKNVTSFIITYFDNDGTEISTPSNAESVKIRIAMEDTVFGKLVSGDHELRGVFRGVD